ncbi:MAG: homocysteine S-methyltransferase family protein [Pseudomonadales bacterium]|nr:homocysteine S-methyltransferase family protein [Pseudomonadales bacterium]
MERLFRENPFILTEAAVVERLRRRDDVLLDESIIHAALIYDAKGKEALSQIYTEYLNLAINDDIPILLATPTWRTNQERVNNSNVKSSINADAVRYLLALRDSHNCSKKNVKIGGIIGCKNDAYKPEEALSTSQAESFHRWQIEELAAGGAEYLMAVTLPHVGEALGIAKAMEKTQLPYIISFVIGKDGKVLEGNSLSEAIKFIDSNTEHRPLAYFVNCSYPSFLINSELDRVTSERLLGVQANASSLEHFELDNAAEIQAESVDEWGDLMLQLKLNYGIKVLGGCCGTNSDHLKYLINEVKENKEDPEGP